MVKIHPLHLFTFCPKCGKKDFVAHNEKAKKCLDCGFTYYFNIAGAVAALLINDKNELLVCRRAKDPAAGTFDLPGGFIDSYETAEQAVQREIQEELGLNLTQSKYLFSLPNIYPYMGFDVHTIDLFFECKVDSFNGLKADDDVSEVFFIAKKDLKPEDFGLTSVSKAIEIYLKQENAY
jgi:mutator protein MutT